VVAHSCSVLFTHEKEHSWLFLLVSSLQLSLYNTFDEYAEGVYCPIYGGFFGVMGATSAMIFSGTSSFWGGLCHSARLGHH
jgi:hypothetical protein